jgi:hypothetical protein
MEVRAKVKNKLGPCSGELQIIESRIGAQDFSLNPSILGDSFRDIPGSNYLRW